jgi:acetolactate synthase-1/2/3 large subunit
MPVHALPKATVAQRVVDALRELGVRHVFGVPSGGWVDYMEVLRRSGCIDFVLTTHEGGAGMMADVCGRLTGVPGVCFGTFGPGATNLATGVGGALLDRSPLIALTDEMPAALRGRAVQMGIDHQALFRPITKATTRLTAAAPKAILFEAARIACSDKPGPVHVGLPVKMSAEHAQDETSGPAPAQKLPPPTAESIKRLRTLLTAARRPLLALGLGAVRAGVREALLTFASTYRLPIVLTPMAKGMVPESHPCYAGVLFHALSDLVGETHGQADLIIAVGYDPVEFNFESWIPKVPLVAIDTVPADIAAGTAATLVDVTGNIGIGVEQLVASTLEVKDWDFEALASRRRRMFERLAPKEHGFGPCAALALLREALPADGIMTCDVGAHTHLIGQQWPTPRPGLQIMTNGWSTMGFGIPSAIAAKLCRPDQEVCCVAGDGGFLMTVGELAVAVRLKLKIVFVVLTDNDLALIRIKQQRKSNPIYGTVVRAAGALGTPSLFGVPVASAGSAQEFQAALKTAFRCDGPAIVEARIDSREYDDLVLRPDKGAG